MNRPFINKMSGAAQSRSDLNTTKSLQTHEILRAPPGTGRVLIPAVIVWAMTAGAITAPGAGVWLVSSGIALGCITVALAMKRQFVRDREVGASALPGALLLFVAVTIVIGLSVTSQHSAREQPGLIQAAAESQVLTFHAQLAGYPEVRQTSFGERYWVRANLEAPQGSVPVILWLTEHPQPHWAPGLHVSVRGTLEKFDPERFDAYGVSVRSIEELTEQQLLARFGAHAAQIRNQLVTAATGVHNGALVPGFAVGDTSLVSEALEEAMRESSLSHLVAVSGANCALVTSAITWLLGRIGAPRRLRLIFAAAALAAFVVIVGPDASVQRAAIMAGVLLLSGFGAKKAVSLPALGCAVLVLLALNPWQALHPGFALSVAATGGILLMASPLSAWFQRRLRLPRVLALPVAVAAAAQFACGPLLLFLQEGIPAVGVVANVIAAPAAPFGTGLGLLAALSLGVSPLLGEFMIHLAAVAAAWVEATAYVTIQLPFARWHWPDGWFGVMLLTLCQMLLIAAWLMHSGRLPVPHTDRLRQRSPWHDTLPAPRAVRRWSASLTCLALGVFVGTSAAAPVATSLATPDNWVVVACDVGQGDATLLRDPAQPGVVILIDTGDDERLLTDCLDRFGVDRISLLVLSHDDADHVAALPAVIDRVDEALIAPSVLGERQEERWVVEQLTRANVPIQVGYAGLDSRAEETDRPDSADPLVSSDSPTVAQSTLYWRVLAPSAHVRPASRNASSLVMTVNTGQATVLLLGDTGNREQQILHAADVKADVLKVAHHGSRDQYPGLPKLVQADWALISVGAGNRHGHPSAETVRDLAWAGSQVLRTDQNGSIALIPTDDGQLVPWAAGQSQ